MKHIGIVACSAEGAALCYKTIVERAAQELGGHAHPEISVNSLSLQSYVEFLDKGDLEGVAALMLDSAHKLARAGADFFICPDNTIHQALKFVVSTSPRPWLHIAEVVAEEAESRGYQNVGVLGTRWLVDSEVYPDKLRTHEIAYTRPSVAERDEVHRIIMDELVHGVFKPESTAYIVGVIEKLRAAGCDAVVLGCTELPLILSDENSPLPTHDSTRLLATAALAHALVA